MILPIAHSLLTPVLGLWLLEEMGCMPKVIQDKFLKYGGRLEVFICIFFNLLKIPVVYVHYIKYMGRITGL